MSNDIANEFGRAITVIPTQAYNSERAARAYMADLRRPRSTLEDDRVANESMAMSYDRRRIVSRVRRVSAESLELIDRALRIHLGLADP